MKLFLIWTLSLLLAIVYGYEIAEISRIYGLNNLSQLSLLLVGSFSIWFAARGLALYVIQTRR